MSDASKPPPGTEPEGAVTPSQAETPTLLRPADPFTRASEVGVGGLAGQVLRGEFRLLRLLGTGGFGEVYLAEQLGGTRVLRQAVVKVLRAEGARSRESVELFRGEAEKMARASHPNVATLYSFWEEPDGRLVLAMEFAGQRDLATEVSRLGRLGVERALELVRQASEGLHAAHRRGVVHRDIKPANLMLSDDEGREVVKVIDFGVARLRRTDVDATLASVSGRGFFTGTPAYSSPEQAEDEPLDARSDVYSLGVVLFELLTGDLPFPRTLTPHQMLFAHFSKTPRAPLSLGVDLPADVLGLLNRALAKRREDRFQSARELADALAARLGRPVSSLPSAASVPAPARAIEQAPVAVPAPPEPTTGRKILPIAAASVLLVALTVVSFWPARTPTATTVPAATPAPIASSGHLVIRSLDAALNSTDATPTDDGRLVEFALDEQGRASASLTFEASGLRVLFVASRIDGAPSVQVTTEPAAPLRVDDILQGAKATLVPGPKAQLVTMRAPGLDRPLRIAVSLRESGKN